MLISSLLSVIEWDYLVLPPLSLFAPSPTTLWIIFINLHVDMLPNLFFHLPVWPAVTVLKLCFRISSGGLGSTVLGPWRSFDMCFMFLKHIR